MKKDTQLTTICVDSADRDTIKELAEQLDLSQRQMVSRLLETYHASLEQKPNASGTSPPPDILTALNESLEKVLKRDDRIVAFIREQEKVLLKPILQASLSTEAQLKQLINILKNLE